MVEMRSVMGGCSFFTSRGSCGVRLPNYRVHQVKVLPPRSGVCLTSLIILISIQLFEEVVNRWNS